MFFDVFRWFCAQSLWCRGQLELEYHDLLSLFEFLDAWQGVLVQIQWPKDNGDGQITLLGAFRGYERQH